jgi:hypothetical protein
MPLLTKTISYQIYRTKITVQGTGMVQLKLRYRFFILIPPPQKQSFLGWVNAKTFSYFSLYNPQKNYSINSTQCKDELGITLKTLLLAIFVAKHMIKFENLNKNIVLGDHFLPWLLMLCYIISYLSYECNTFDPYMVTFTKIGWNALGVLTFLSMATGNDYNRNYKLCNKNKL